MSETDQPLKILARQYICDVASWLLGQKVVAAEEANVELTIETSPRVDLIFHLKLADGRLCLFHLEFQGRRSRPAMSRRQLNHLSRLALRQNWPMVLESFVLYVEKYTGSRDKGHYQIERLDGSPALGWNYTPVHLWREPAEPLLALDRPGLIPLMGRMQIQRPETTLPAMVKQIQSEVDETKRQGLFSSLLALMDDEECLAMLERLIEADELILDTPFLRRLRKQARTEGLSTGLQQGQIQAHRDDILQAIEVRLDLSLRAYREIERRLAQVSDVALLRQLFTAALQAKSLDAFTVALSDLTP